MRGTNAQVMHAWANAHDTEGRNGTGTVYFEGDTIFSYGAHFPMARRLDFDTYFYTTDSYSPTTGKQLSGVRSAIGWTRDVFHVKNVLASSPGEHRENYQDYISRVEGTAGYYTRARTSKEHWLDRLKELIDEANEYRERFTDVKESLDIETYLGAGFEEKLKQAQEEARAAKKAAREKAEKAAAEGLADWRRCLRNTFAGIRTIGVKLRYNPGNGMVETTMGVHFPASEAVRAWRVILICRAKGIEWKSNGEQVELGHYRVNRVYPDGRLIAGCHDVPYEESKYIAEQLGLAELTVTEGGVK